MLSGKSANLSSKANEPWLTYEIAFKRLLHVAVFQAAFLRLPCRLALVERSRATRLMPILRSRTKLRTAVESQIRQSSSRNVTFSTRCRLFSMDP